MTEETKRFLTKATENRQAFLDPYRLKFESTSDEKARAEIVITLLKIEPSHLTEPWIVTEVVRWMRKSEYLPWLEEGFIAQKGRVRPTHDQEIRLARKFFLKERVDAIQEDLLLSKEKVFARLAERETDGDDQKDSIKHKYYRFENPLEKRTLPFPYLGHDVEVRADGTCHLILHHRKVQKGNHPGYGTYTLELA
jgi:hypothetical protein